MNGAINVIIFLAIIGMGLGIIVRLAGGNGKLKERAGTMAKRLKSVKIAKLAQARIDTDYAERERVRDKYRR
jgi:hypothetical protein